MKAFFILLLLTNIFFALAQWLLPYEPIDRRTTPHFGVEKLKLLDEVEAPRVEMPRVEVVEQKVQPEDSVLDDTPLMPDKLCYTLGPFKDQQVAQEIALKFKQNRISISTRSSLEKEYMGVMVYVDGHETRNDAVKTAEALALKGVRDYIIVEEPGKSNILSLGVFSLKKNADRRMSIISRLGYPVKSEARYRGRTIYWLDYSESENENLTRFIDTLKIEQGISRISRQCR